MYEKEQVIIEFLNSMKFVRTDNYFLRFELIEDNIKYEISVFRADMIETNIILTKYENNIHVNTERIGFLELKKYFKYKLRLHRIEKLLKDESLDSKS